LLGAAVDNEEVSKHPRDILDDKTNWGTAKSDYGEAIENEVGKFYNLFNPRDNALKPNLNPALQVYPKFEGDLALGQSGYQISPEKPIALPSNYKQIDVQNEIPFDSDADGDGKCDLPVPNTQICTIIGIGDNHAGYFGFRDSSDDSKLGYDGSMDIVVKTWKYASFK
jgi:hypothetical protein